MKSGCYSGWSQKFGLNRGKLFGLLTLQEEARRQKMTTKVAAVVETNDKNVVVGSDYNVTGGGDWYGLIAGR